jgi:hypothetical protein
MKRVAEISSTRTVHCVSSAARLEITSIVCTGSADIRRMAPPLMHTPRFGVA